MRPFLAGLAVVGVMALFVYSMSGESVASGAVSSVATENAPHAEVIWRDYPWSVMAIVDPARHSACYVMTASTATGAISCVPLRPDPPEAAPGGPP